MFTEDLYKALGALTALWGEEDEEYLASLSFLLVQNSWD